MGGRASLILVVAFGLLFGLMGTQMLKSSNDANDNFVNYYIKTKAHNIASSAANMAANKLFIDKNWNAGYNNLAVDDGYVDVSVQTYDINSKKITCISDFSGYQDTVIVWLEPKNFAQFGNFINVMGGVWAASGDTFNGPFHTNDFLNCTGDPVFKGFTSSLKGVKLFDGNSHPEFHGGLASGVSIPLTFDENIIRNAATAGGKVFESGNSYINVKLNFNDNGTVTYWQRNGAGGPWGDSTIADLATLAPNGVIYVKKGDVFIQGTLNGKITVMADKDGTGGKINITDDIVYNQNPLLGPSDDLLGLVAQDKIIIPFDPARGDFSIHASMYAQSNAIVIDQYNNYPTAYHMNILGGVITNQIEATAHYELINGKWTPIRGYSYIHKFDQRFLKEVPPFFPLTDKFRVVSWLE